MNTFNDLSAGRDIYSRFKGFLIFSAFYIVLYYYHQTVVYDRLYLLIIVQSAIFCIYLLSIYRIRAGLYAFILLLPLLNSVTTIIGIRRVTIIFYIFAGLFLGFLVNRFKSDSSIEYDIELARPAFIFLVILTISSAVTIYRYANFVPFITTRFHDLIVNNADHTAMEAILWTVKYYFNYIVGFGLLVIVFNVIKKRKDFINCIAIVISTAILVILFGLYQKFFYPVLGSSSFWVKAGRINSTFTDPNALGGYIGLVFPLFVSIIVFLKKWYFKVLASALLLLFIYFGFLSGSRSAFLSMAVSSAVFIMIGLAMAVRHFLKRKIRLPVRSAIASGAIIVVLFTVVISSFTGIMAGTQLIDNLDDSAVTGIIVVDRIIETAAEFSRTIKSEGFLRALESISSGREVLWKQAVFMYKEHPVSGVGHAAYFIELPDYHLKHHIGYHLLDFSGNYYLQILSELGTAGIILMLFIFFLVAAKPLKYFISKTRTGKLARKDWLETGLLVSFLSMVIALFFGPHTNFIEIQFFFWLVISLIIVYIKIETGKEDKKSIILSGNYRMFRFDIYSRVALIIIVVLFSLALFGSSTGDLSINVKNSMYDHDNNYGFYQEEYEEGRPFRWIGMDASRIVHRKGDIIIIPVKASYPVDYKIPNFIRIYVDNTLVKLFRLTDDSWHDIEIDLAGFERERFTLTISMNRAWVPKELGLSSDTRELGIKVGEFRFDD